MTYTPEQEVEAVAAGSRSRPLTTALATAARARRDKLADPLRRLVRAELGERTAGWQAGALFAIVGAISIANDVLPISLGHGQGKALLIDVVVLVTGLLAMTLPWARWDQRWSLVLACLAFGNIAWSNTVTVSVGPSYGIYFIVIFVWVGAWFPRWTSPILAPIAGAAYLVPVFAGSAVPVGTVPSVWVVIPAGVLVGESIAHNAARVARVNEEISYRALHDALTGLANRALIIDRAEQMLARSAREPVAVGALFLDLDNFKEVNDTYGHQRGDELLRAFAGRLAAVVRPGDSVGRMGGDEFVVLVQGSAIDAGPEVVAQRILDVLRPPFYLDSMRDVPVFVRTSIGVAVGARPNVDELLRDADVALYQAKGSGKSTYVLFRADMGTAAQDRLVLGVDLRDAIANNELFLEYQPTFDLGKSVLSGVEALVQWQHPTRGLIASEQLLLIAEEVGMIVAINRFALAESCRQSAAWSRQGRAIPISLRISEDQLLSDELAAEVEQALRGNGMSPDLLTLEVVELVLMEDPDRAVDRLRRLKELGLRITVDDFGTGYFSQTYSLRFPFDALKIDRKFTANIASSKRARSLTQAFVDLGVTLGLSTFADSIDDHAQLGEVQRRYCDHGRGYYSTHPLSPAEIEDLFVAEGGLGSDPSHPTDSAGHSCVPAKSTAG